MSNEDAEPEPANVWEQIVPDIAEPICAFDTAFRLIAFNPAHNAEFFRVNGFHTKLGDVFPDLFVEAQRPVMRSLMTRALTGESFTVVEAFGNPGIAAPRWEISYRALRDGDGRIVGAFHRARDMSDKPVGLDSLLRVSDVERDLDDTHYRRIVQRLDEDLRDVEESDAIAALCAEVVGRALDAGSAGFGTMLPDGEHMAIERDWVAEGAVSVVGTHRLHDFGNYQDVLQRGDDFVVADVNLDQRTAHRAAAYAAVRVRSAVNIPIMERGRYVAMFFVLTPSPRLWRPAELSFIRNVGERARINIERRRAEAALRALTADLERQVHERTMERDRLWETSVDLLAHADFDGTIHRMSPSWTRTLGHSEHALKASSYMTLVHPDDVEGVTRALALARSSESPVRHSNRLRHADGSWRTLDWSLVPEPAKQRFNAVGRDVTAEREADRVRLHLEMQLRQAQKMEAVGQLTGGLAHDFDNLLASLSGNLQLMRLRLTQGKVDDLMRRVESGMDSVRRAATLTQRLLAFSRQQALQSRPTDLNDLVAGMEELIHGAIGPAVQLQSIRGSALWPTQVDPSQLESALLNLCINARDAMAPAGGILTITTANELLDADQAFKRELPAGAYVSLSVADTGAGMAPDVVSRVFDPFFTTKPIGQGTGLGLSMVYGFVRQSGGQIRVDTALGRGTTMCLYLPRFDGALPPVEGAVAAPPPDGARHETVLVVEDEAAIRMLLVELLQEAGYTVLEAEDGASALRQLQSGAAIDLLLTDVGLPGGMNGRQVADVARTSRPELTVLFLTGYAENAAAWSGHLADGMHVMTKPFDIPELMVKVREVLL